MKVSQFIFDNSQQQLTLVLSGADGLVRKQLSFEYLRISSPEKSPTKPNTPQAIISHKKDVLLINIESVGKHGYRLIFNDSHSAIYGEDYLEIIAVNYDDRWQQYLSALKTSGHSREAMIDIKQV